MPIHGTEDPKMAVGTAGILLMVIGKALARLPPHPFEAVTVMLPALLPAFTKMVVLPWPETIVQPLGTVQV